jgi:hypothetical protein
MTRYRVYCIELDLGKDIEDWIKHIVIRGEDNRERKVVQDEAIRLIETGDVIYIDKDHPSNPKNNDIELIIKTSLNKRYIHTSEFGTLYAFYEKGGACRS